MATATPPASADLIKLSILGKDNIVVITHNNSRAIINKTYLKNIRQLPVSSHRPSGDSLYGPQAPMFTASEMILSPNQQSPLFMDYHQAKYWLIIDGSASITVGGQSVQVGQQQAIFIPKMTEHRITNVMNSVVTIIEFRTKIPLTGNEVVDFSANLAGITGAINNKQIKSLSDRP